VVNFDVPAAPEDYIHRVGRTGRAELTGDAFTLVAPEEESDLKAIERAIGRTLPRITVPDFDYRAKPHVRLEIPIAQRIAAIRAQKAQERARAKLNEARRAGQLRPSGPTPRPDGAGSKVEESGQRKRRGSRPSSHRRRRARSRS
jgi:ATP-dependent RNA helicase RhlE